MAALHALVFATLLLAGAAEARPIAREGLVFSDELGGFVILQVTGSGYLHDPFVVVEEVDSPDLAALVIRGLSAEFGNRVGTQHLVGFALTKVAINRTGGPWTLYQLELRELLESHSPYGDGLSFGQAATVGRPFTSSAFAANREIDEPYDSVLFADGIVAADEKAAFEVVVTDTSPVATFFLLQQQLHEVALSDPTGQMIRRAP